MRPNVFTIPTHRAFSDALAAGLLSLHGGSKTGLIEGTILVPNQRAARSIQEAFVRRAGGGLLLPRLVPIGDEALDERVNGSLDPLGEERAILPAINPAERLMLLAGLVQRHLHVDGAEAIRLATNLASTLDQLLIEEVDPARLKSIASEFPDLSLHWQQSLAQLQLIVDEWPALLRARRQIDRAQRRNQLFDALARRWSAQPPPGFLCAAGINLTAPAAARLLAAIACARSGMVVLPGLDLSMPEAEWQSLGTTAEGRDREQGATIETHPQFHLKLLLDRMGIHRGEVKLWRWGGGHDSPAVRSRVIAHALTPAAFTGKWQKLPLGERRLTGVKAVELADPAEESQAIAIALRESLETPGQTAALVTPDRALARRVSAHLARWGIEADDSAGRPLAQTPPGTLILGLLEAATQRFGPVPLLGLLKHPLVMAGERRLSWLDGVRKLDLALRGPRPAPGLAGISAHLDDREARDSIVRSRAAGWWEDVVPLLGPFERACSDQSDLPAFWRSLRETVTALSGNHVWSGPAGKAAAEWLESYEAASGLGPELRNPAALRDLVGHLMLGQAVRPPYGQHPRINIWGLLEARLQQADLVILGGLNEGVWPPLPSPDPWLAPRIRSELGLPSLERRIGLAAHDFATALGAPRVLVTRSRRDGRAEALASRFWLRLEALTGGLTRAPLLRKLAARIDRPGSVPAPAGRPAPAPPVGDRPSRISVTDVDRLKADPFAFYARKLLRLSALDPVDAEPSPAWRGTAVHLILEEWMRHDDCDPTRLLERAEELLAGSAVHPILRAMWQPRLLEAIDFIAEEVERKRAEGRLPIVAEISGEASIAGVNLTGKADRIDRLLDGSLAIVDYKTGTPPSNRAVAEGYSLQLGLLGAIAERGGFKGIEGTPSCFEYWSLARKAGRLGFVSTPTGPRSDIAPEEFVDLAERNFTQVVETWLTGSAPFTAKLNPLHAPYSEFDQLMRLDEWYGAGPTVESAGVRSGQATPDAVQAGKDKDDSDHDQKSVRGHFLGDETA